MEQKLTYSLIFEIELDALHFIYEEDRPIRFSTILSGLLTYQKYSCRDPAVVKSSLAKALNDLIEDGVLRKTEKSHKFRTYNIKNREKAKLLLKLHRNELFALDRQAETLSLKETTLQNLHATLVFRFAMFLLMYEHALCEALVAYNKSSFTVFAKSGKHYLEALWDSFTATLDDRSKKIVEFRGFYEQCLKDIHGEIEPSGMKTESGMIVEVNSWIEVWKANHHAELKLCKRLEESFRECLSNVERNLKTESPITEEQLVRNALEGLKILGGRALSREEMEELKERKNLG